MVSIEKLLGILGGVTDSASVIQSVRKRLQNLSANKIYTNLLDEQFRNERSHSKLDIRLDKKKMQKAMRQSAIDLKRAPLLADKLDNVIGDKIVEILANGVVVSGSSELDQHRAKAIVKRVHQQYFEKIKTEIPELVEVLQYQEISQNLRKLHVTIRDLSLVQTNQNRTLETIDQKTDDIFDSVERTSTQIEQSQLAFEAYQQEILNILRQRSASSDSRPVFEPSASIDAPPQFGTLYTNRIGPVENIFELLNKHNWVAITGQAGSGKTGLATIVHTKGHYKSRWISFLGLDGNEARNHLRKQLFFWLKDLKLDISDTGLRINQLLEVISVTTAIGLVILDNLPDPANPNNDLIYQDLRHLGLSCSTRNISILSTGQRDLPFALTSVLSTVSFHAPQLLDVEIGEMLQSIDAPNYYLQTSTVTYIKAITKGLVALVAAYIVWYQRNNWPQSATFIESVLTEEPGLELREEQQRKLYRLLEDEAIELLSRLSLLVSDFDPMLVKIVAQIPNEIRHPHLVFSSLKNVWVPELETERYQVSPLLKDIGRKNLSIEKQRLVASSVADFYMKEKQPIGLDDVENIALYLWIASRKIDFAQFLTQALMRITTPIEAQYIKLSTLTPSNDIGFPDEVPIYLQIILRTQQFRVRLLAGENVDENHMELNRLISRATDIDVSAIIYAYIITGMAIAMNQEEYVDDLVDHAIRNTFSALQLLAENPNAFLNVQQALNSNSLEPSDVGAIFDDNLGSIVWFWVSKINSQQRVKLFIEEIYKTTKEVRDVIFSSPLVSGLPHILDQLWLIEGRKPEKLRNKTTFVAFYDEVLDFATKHNISSLQVAVARAKAITVSEIDKGLDRAIVIMESIPKYDNTDLLAWTNITLALLHNDYGSPENAQAYLEKVIELPGHVADDWRITMRKHLTVAYSKQESWNKAKSQAIVALKESRDSSHPPYSHLEILGELACVYWNMGDIKRSIGAFYTIYNSLKNTDQFTVAEFNEIYHKFSHILGQCYRVSGRIDSRHQSIESGWFARSLPKSRDFEREHGNTLIAPALPLILIAIDADCHGIAWQLWQNITQSSELEVTFLKSLVYARASSLEARFGTPAKSIKYGIKSFKVKAVIQSLLDVSNQKDVLRPVNIDDSWNLLSDSEQASYEKLLLFELLIPWFLELLRRDASTTEITSICVQYRDAFESFTHLHSYTDFQQTLDIFEQLLLARANGIPANSTSTNVEIIDLLSILSTYDINRTVSLHDKLRVQMYIATFIWENRQLIPVKHTMQPLGRMFYSFWKNVVKNQRFLLSNPDLMATRLKTTSNCRSEITVANVLRIASDGVGLQLDKSTRDFIKEVLGDNR